jgi:hypothetical protein
MYNRSKWALNDSTGAKNKHQGIALDASSLEFVPLSSIPYAPTPPPEAAVPNEASVVPSDNRSSLDPFKWDYAGIKGAPLVLAFDELSDPHVSCAPHALAFAWTVAVNKSLNFDVQF